MQNAGRMRTALGKLADVAARYCCAIVLVGHLNKSYGGKNLYRGLGSIDIAAIARSVLMISRDSTDHSVRYMFPIKSSLAPEGSAIGFTFGEGNFKWLGRCDVDINSIEDRIFTQPDKLNQAKKFLLQILEGGDLPSTQVYEMVERSGIKKRTAETAKKELGIMAYKKNNAWYWRLPQSQTMEVSINE